MKYLLVFKEDLPVQELDLVKAYWAIEAGEFVHKVGDLAKRHGLSVPALTHLAIANATCHISFGFCLGCGDELLETVTSKSAFLAAQTSFSWRRCPACQHAYDKRQQFEQQQAAGQVGSALGPNAVELRAWELLPSAELEVLKAIVQLKLKPLIYAQLFQDGNLGNKEVWTILNRLVRKGLLVINHDYEVGQGHVVEGFSYPPALEQVFSGCVLESAPGSVTDYLGLKLMLNPDKSRNYKAMYTGVCTMQEDVLLRRGVQYAYAGWVRTKDSSITLQLTAFEQVLTEAPGGNLVEAAVVNKLLGRFVGDPGAQDG
jgi:hypothetical protein